MLENFEKKRRISFVQSVNKSRREIMWSLWSKADRHFLHLTVSDRINDHVIVYYSKRTEMLLSWSLIKACSHRQSPSRQRNKRYVDGQNGYATHSDVIRTFTPVILWTIACVIAISFQLTKIVVSRKKFSLRLLCIRACLLAVTIAALVADVTRLLSQK